MPAHFLNAADRVSKPWQNGGGITTDVLVWPQGASMQDFVARVSIAEISADGPFSIFHGIDRSTAILSGEGFDLAFENAGTHRLTAYTPPLSYAGDDAAYGRLLAGTTMDLNAMSRRAAARHTIRKTILTTGTILTAEGLSVVLLATGEATLAIDGGQSRLGPLDAVALSDGDSVTVMEGIATAWRIDFAITPI